RHETHLPGCWPHVEILAFFHLALFCRFRRAPHRRFPSVRTLSCPSDLALKSLQFFVWVRFVIFLRPRLGIAAVFHLALFCRFARIVFLSTSRCSARIES